MDLEKPDSPSGIRRSVTFSMHTASFLPWAAGCGEEGIGSREWSQGFQREWEHFFFFMSKIFSLLMVCCSGMIHPRSNYKEL